MVVPYKGSYIFTTEVILKPSLHIYTSQQTSRNIKTKAASVGLSVSELVDAMIEAFLEDQKAFEGLVDLVVCEKQSRKSS